VPENKIVTLIADVPAETPINMLMLRPPHSLHNPTYLPHKPTYLPHKPTYLPHNEGQAKGAELQGQRTGCSSQT
jgi:hypothetical protein